MKVRIIIKEIKSLVYENDFKDLLEKIKYTRGKSVEDEYTLYNSIIEYIKKLSKEEIDMYLPIIMKILKSNCKTFYKFPYMLLMEMGLLYGSNYEILSNIYKIISKKTVDVLRHYVSLGDPEESYIWAFEVDERYHPLTWKICKKDRFYRKKYLETFENEIPHKERI